MNLSMNTQCMYYAYVIHLYLDNDMTGCTYMESRYIVSKDNM